MHTVSTRPSGPRPGTALVVMERGSHWPARCHRGLELVAIQQDEDECEDALLRRTCERIQGIEARGGTILRAVLSCNDDMVSRTLDGRILIARALFASVLRGKRGRLHLVAQKSAALRFAVLAIAETLAAEIVGTPARISARFVGARA